MGSRAGRRVCILRQSDWYEPNVQREAEALADAGFDVEVICMRADGVPRRSIVNGVRIIRLPAARNSSSKAGRAFEYGHFFVLAAAVLSARHIRRPYTVVQAYSMPDFLVFATLIPKLSGSRIVAFMGEPTPELAETIFGPSRLTAVLARIEQWAIRFADHSFAVTDQLKQRFVERGAAADRITVVLNGADPDSMFGQPSPRPPESRSEFTVVCHGTIEDRYGHDTIIDAVRLLRQQMPDLRVIFTGHGSGTAEILHKIAAHGLAPVVRFEGWVSRARLKEILLSADVGIIAQKASPYSHLVHTDKMMDYWILGLPVIASRLRAVSELYDDRFIEYFRPGDAVDLAAAIRRLRADPARRAELARNGKIAQVRNGWATQRHSYLGVFDSILADHSGTRPPAQSRHRPERIPPPGNG